MCRVPVAAKRRGEGKASPRHIVCVSLMGWLLQKGLTHPPMPKGSRCSHRMVTCRAEMGPWSPAEVATNTALSCGVSLCKLGMRGSAHFFAPHFSPTKPSRSSGTTEQRPLTWYGPHPPVLAWWNWDKPPPSPNLNKSPLTRSWAETSIQLSSLSRARETCAPVGGRSFAPAVRLLPTCHWQKRHAM